MADNEEYVYPGADEFEYQTYDAEEFQPPKWKFKNATHAPTYGTGGRAAKTWNEEQEQVLLDKLENRAKFSYNPDLVTKRGALIWLLSHNKDPKRYSIVEKDMDNDPRTPLDVIIREGDEENGRLIAAGGYRMKHYGKRDKIREKLRTEYISTYPDRQKRAETFSKYIQGTEAKADSHVPSAQVNSLINKAFLTEIREKWPDFKAGCLINGDLELSTPAYFALLQPLHRTFKNCIALPAVISALNGGTPYNNVEITMQNYKGQTVSAGFEIKANPYAYKLFKDKVNIKPPGNELSIEELKKSDGKTWGTSLYKAYADTPKYTVWRKNIGCFKQRFNKILYLHFKS
jgi:hypothetical protein